MHTAAAEIEAAGGAALAVVGDVRVDEDVERAVQQAVERFGGVDVVVDNASALDLRATRDIDMKRYDLMQDINARGAFLLAETAISHLERSDNAHSHVELVADPSRLVPTIEDVLSSADLAPPPIEGVRR